MCFHQENNPQNKTLGYYKVLIINGLMKYKVTMFTSYVLMYVLEMVTIVRWSH